MSRQGGRGWGSGGKRESRETPNLSQTHSSLLRDRLERARVAQSGSSLALMSPKGPCDWRRRAGMRGKLEVQAL